MSVNTKIVRRYVSEIDRFLQTLNETSSLSLSQQKEIAKYKRIYRLRDEPTTVNPASSFWDDF